MLDFTNKIYTVDNVYSVDRKNFQIDITKPYTIVSGNVGSGKSTYIEAIKKFNPEMQYLEVGDIVTVDMYVRTKADFIIDIRRYNYAKKD